MFALITVGGPIYGVGETQDLARDDAAQWLSGGADEAKKAHYLPHGVFGGGRHANVSDGALAVVPCSPALAAYVREHGAPDDYDEQDGVLLLRSEAPE